VQSLNKFELLTLSLSLNKGGELAWIVQEFGGIQQNQAFELRH
jgi:hypothetical protein